MVKLDASRLALALWRPAEDVRGNDRGRPDHESSITHNGERTVRKPLVSSYRTVLARTAWSTSIRDVVNLIGDVVSSRPG